VSRRVKFAAILLLVGAVTWIIIDAAYVVAETEQVIITQFGDPVGQPVAEAGLHFKLPFIQDTHYFERRILEYEGRPTEAPTKDKFFIRIATFARWRISDPLKFFQRVRDEQGALPRMDEILDGETRNAVSQYNLVEVARSTNRPLSESPSSPEEQAVIQIPLEKGRATIGKEILERAALRTTDLGIQLLDMKFKRIDYVPDVQNAVFARMIAERRRMAELYRSEGEGESARINGERERELKRIQSEAYRQAQLKVGEADARATRIYADAYGRDPGFYAFMKRLESYEQTMDHGTTLLLDTDSDYLRMLKRRTPQ